MSELSAPPSSAASASVLLAGIASTGVAAVPLALVASGPASTVALASVTAALFFSSAGAADIGTACDSAADAAAALSVLSVFLSQAVNVSADTKLSMVIFASVFCMGIPLLSINRSIRQRT